MAEVEEEEVVIAEKASKEEEDKGEEFQESTIEAAMKARAGHIKEQSNSLTLEGVRRLLEKDLGLEQYALDKHKRFVKQLLADLTEDSNDVNDSKNGEDAGEKGNDDETGEKGVVKEEQEESLENHQGGKDTNEALSQDTSRLDDSPVFGLLKEKKAAKSKREKSEEVVEKKAPTNKTIAAAIRKRAKYLKVNSEQLTLAGLRRLLEEDLELEKHSLDPFKNFIRDQVDEVLLDPKKSSRSSPSVKKKVVTKNVKQKVARKVESEESSDSAESDSDEDEDDVKPKRKNVRKEKASNTPMKRKKPTEDKKTGGKKIKTAEKSTDDNNSDEENGNFSEDNHSHSSAEKSTKSKVVSTPTYGKRVETLKSVIKSCGMSVPPALYKKIKQVPESKRESQLIKELKDILSKEGLSSNPSEKEIKEVRKRKERAKELEGIDMSNIVSSTRRRSTASYAVTAKPKIPVESGSESSEEEEEDDDGDDDDDDDDNGNDGSQSEESNVEDEGNSD